MRGTRLTPGLFVSVVMALVLAGTSCSNGGGAESASDEPSAGVEQEGAREALERWLEAVRRDKAARACDLMTAEARRGFAENVVGLPHAMGQGEPCPRVIRQSRRGTPPDLQVGPARAPKSRCTEPSDRSASVPWKSRQWQLSGEPHLGLQAMCFIGGRWLVDHDIWRRFIDD